MLYFHNMWKKKHKVNNCLVSFCISFNVKPNRKINKPPWPASVAAAVGCKFYRKCIQTPKSSGGLWKLSAIDLFPVCHLPHVSHAFMYGIYERKPYALARHLFLVKCKAQLWTRLQRRNGGGAFLPLLTLIRLMYHGERAGSKRCATSDLQKRITDLADRRGWQNSFPKTWLKIKQKWECTSLPPSRCILVFLFGIGLAYSLTTAPEGVLSKVLHPKTRARCMRTCDKGEKKRK